MNSTEGPVVATGNVSDSGSTAYDDELELLNMVQFYVYDVTGSVLFTLGIVFNLLSFTYFQMSRSFRDTSMPQRLEQARTLLAEAGYGPDKPLKLAYSHSTVGEMKRIAVAIAAMWQRINVDVMLQGTEGKVLFANLRQGNYEVAYAGWSADFDDAASFLYLLQSSAVASNYSRYRNKAYDDFLAGAARTADAKSRADLLRQAEAIALRDQPILPVAFGVSKSLIRPTVRGWEPNAIDVHLSRYLRLEP